LGTDLVDGDESTVLLQNHTTHHTRQPLGIVNYTYDTSIMIGDWLKLKSWRPARLNTDNGFMTDLNALLHCWAIHRPYEPLYATISFGMQQMERCEWRCLMCDGWNLMAITMTPERMEERWRRINNLLWIGAVTCFIRYFGSPMVFLDLTTRTCLSGMYVL